MPWHSPCDGVVLSAFAAKLSILPQKAGFALVDAVSGGLSVELTGGLRVVTGGLDSESYRLEKTVSSGGVWSAV